jgi:hypothetical protein
MLENSILPASWASASDRSTCGCAPGGEPEPIIASGCRAALAGSFRPAPSQPAGADRAVSRAGVAYQTSSDASG